MRKQTLQLDKLPSEQFDKECKELLNINLLDEAVVESDLKKPLDKWIQEFKKALVPYFSNKCLPNVSEENALRICRNFNYWLSYVGQKIQTIITDKGTSSKFIESIKEFVKITITGCNKYPCKLEFEEYTAKLHM
ncbi:unnamed protein product [Plasmodium vivax]|uniref:(malaria parasite P. vivax) hypothetical protein n=1 Tax=Plasmodium vivax TaxID=5855 RepID=A0A8S4HGC3_PLAVI|nr:unnamed protein product [Plasmodium vivax]